MTGDKAWIARALAGTIDGAAGLRAVAIARAMHTRGELPWNLVELLEAGDQAKPEDQHPARYKVARIGPEPVETDAGTNVALDRLMAELGQLDPTFDSWRPVDLTAALAGDKVRPEPTILRRSDGKALLYEGQVNYLHGADGAGKSYAALFAAVEVLGDGDHVVWLDWEDPDETTVVGRLLDLGVSRDVIADRFHYVHPQTEATPAAVEVVCDLARSVVARLVVVDSVGEAMGVDSVNEDRDNEVTPWMRRVLRPLAATGAAVLPIDHGTKSTDNPLHPSGSKRKRAQVTGAHYLVEAPRPLSKEFGGGRLRLTTAKDRHGNYTRGKVAAEIDVTIYPDGGWTIHVAPPAPVARQDGAEVDRALARQMVAVAAELAAETGAPPSLTMLEQSKRVKGAVTAKRAAVEYAVAAGALQETEGPRRARLFTYLNDLET